VCLRPVAGLLSRRLSVGEHHQRSDKANRCTGGSEKQDFAWPIFRLQCFPAIHPKPHFPSKQPGCHLVPEIFPGTAAID
jgi:hypothetical protein